MKTQVLTVRRMAFIVLAAGMTLLAGCSHNSATQQSATSQAVVQSTIKQANDMDAWRQAHPGQEHP